MDTLVSRLTVYKKAAENSFLARLAGFVADWKKGSETNNRYQSALGDLTAELLEIATRCGLDENLWQGYLACFLLTAECPFSLTVERAKEPEGSIHQLVKGDMERFFALFHYDFSAMEQSLGTDLFSVLTHYRAIPKNERAYNKGVSGQVMALMHRLKEASDPEEFYLAVTDTYRQVGVGTFGLNHAFRVEKGKDGRAVFLPISNLEQKKMSDLLGYEWQKAKLIENTEAFLEHKPANNVLLFGDSGTGKSSCIKALVSSYGDKGLRVIEIYKHQFELLSDIIGQIKSRNYRFLLYMDDLSFEEFEIEYKYLKAVIEGDLEVRPDNLLIYATSNRRHLIRETWKDKTDSDNELHRNDTVEEKLSLVHRFGLTINFSKPNRKEYHEIVKFLAQKAGLDVSDEAALFLAADRWEMTGGGISGRTAEQFVQSLSGKETT